MISIGGSKNGLRLKSMKISIFLMLMMCSVAFSQLVHPGLSHKKSDLERMKYMVESQKEPFYSTYQMLSANATASYDYTVRGNTSLTEVYRNSPKTNLGSFESDSRAAYYNALRWWIEGDTRYADKAVECLMAWTGLTYVQSGGTEALTSNLVIVLLEAAELMKGYTGWSAADQLKFSDMLVYPGYSNTTIPSNLSTQGTWYWRSYKFDPVRAGNQELCGIRTCMAIGVFLDDQRIYDRAYKYVVGYAARLDDIPYPVGPHVQTGIITENEYRVSYSIEEQTTQSNFHGNGMLTNYIYENGQCEESSRDQGHTAFGNGILCHIGEITWNQGDDFYAKANFRVLSGLEFTLRYNVSFLQSYPDQLTPWEPTFESGEFIQKVDATGRTKSLKICPTVDNNPTGSLTRGTFMSQYTWELPIAHYVGRGIKTEEDAKWTIRARDYSIDYNGTYESGPTGGAYLGYGGLTYRRPQYCFGDPISGFDSNGLPIYKMNVLPMTIEAENFDYFTSDGEDHTYSDETDGNSSGVYRSNENVDIQTRTNGGYFIESMDSGEYLTYTVYVPGDGEYNISANYSGINANGTLRVLVDGVDKTGAINLPSTGGLENWVDIALANNVSLLQGVQSIKIVVGGTNSSFNLNSFSVTLVNKINQTITFSELPIREVGDEDLELIASASSGLEISFSSSDTGVASVVNGTLQINGIGIATITASQAGNDLFETASAIHYFQVNATASGLLVQAENFSVNSGLRSESTTDIGGGLNMGHTASGDYLEYTVNVSTTGIYLVDYRIASSSDGGSLNLLVNGTKVDNLDFFATGGWQTWETISSYIEVSLAAGTNKIRLNVDSSGWNINWFKFNKKDATLAAENVLGVHVINIYPNPVTDTFIITDCKNSILELYSALGKLVLSEKIVSDKHSINISRFISGVYIVEISKNGSKITNRILKK